MTGFEPAASCSQSRRATNCATPGYSLFCHYTTAGRKIKDFLSVVIPVVKAAFVPFSATGGNPANAGTARLCGISPYPVPDTATALPNDGVAAMVLLRGPRPMTPYDSQFLRDRLRGKEYLPLAYFDGATPQNGYRPTAPYTLTVLPDQRPQDVEEGYLRVFLQTAGADAPRPVKLRQKPSTGEWFLWEYSSPLSGIRIPASQDPWA